MNTDSDLHSPERWRADLIAAGWVAERHDVWRAPSGALFRGPYGAWRALQAQQKGAAVREEGTVRCSPEDAALISALSSTVPVHGKDRDRCENCGTAARLRFRPDWGVDLCDSCYGLLKK